MHAGVGTGALRRAIVTMSAVVLVAAGAVGPSTAATGTTAWPVAAPTRAQGAADGLMSFFQPGTGLFTTKTEFDFARWWTSALAVRSLAEYSKATHSSAYLDAIATTYDKNVAGHDWGTGQFRNEYIDDTGWWAMAWVSAYDLTGQQRYLDTARAAADHMAEYWTDDVCGGGVLWSTQQKYRSSISNSLYLEVSAALHRRIPGDTTYLQRAVDEWRWFAGTGLVGSDGLVMDGRSPTADGRSCVTSTNRYTYNQGQLVAGLVELYRSDDASSPLSTTERGDVLAMARRVADAATTSSTLNRTATVLGMPTGVLLDGCELNRDGDSAPCGGDGPAFKGPAVRGVAALNRLLPAHPYSAYLYRQQAAAETSARTAGSLYGLRWFPSADDASGSTGPKPQSAALALFDATLGLPSRTVTVSTGPAPSGSGWYRAPVTVHLAAPSDEPEAAVEHSLDGRTWTQGPTVELGDGRYALRARVLDTATAQLPQTVTTLDVDTVAPRVHVASVAGGPRRTVTLDARDASSGVLRLEYRLNGEAWRTYSGPVVVDDAVTSLEYRSADVAGNESGTVSLSVPGAPTGVMARAGNEQVALSWSAPSADGGSAVTSYSVERSTYSVSSRTWGGFTTVTTTTTTPRATISALANGTRYRFRVRAANVVGHGPSGPVVTSVPLGPASAPTAVKARRGDTDVALTWAAPSSTGGSTVLGYTVQKRTYSSSRKAWSSWTGAASTTAAARSATVTRLTNGTSYQFRVSARTSVGTGAASGPVTVVPAGSPRSPGSVKVVASAHKARISWKKAASNGSAISSYRVQYSTNGTTWKTLATTPATASSYTWTTPTKGKRYSLRVYARNSVGRGPASSTVTFTGR